MYIHTLNSTQRFATHVINPIIHLLQMHETHIHHSFFLLHFLTKLSHSHLYFSPSNLLSSEVVTSLNTIETTHIDCVLLLSFYIIKILKIILPDPSYFILSQCQPPISILFSTFRDAPLVPLTSYFSVPSVALP